MHYYYYSSSWYAFFPEPLILIFGETGWRAVAFDQVLLRDFVPLAECGKYTKKFLLALHAPQQSSNA